MRRLHLITVRNIQDAVADQYGITRLALLSERRAREVSRPRQLAMWICRELTRKSLPTIAVHFEREHTTVMHAVRVVPTRLEADPELRQECLEIMSALELVQRSTVVPFPGAVRAAARDRVEHAVDVFAEALVRDPVGTLAKLARRFGDGPRPEVG